MFLEPGARKKKWLTDPVDIVPFPSQNLRDKIPATPKPNAPIVRQAPLIEHVEPKNTSVPIGKLSSSTLSIKQLMEKKEEEQAASSIMPENMPMNSFSYDQVKMLWRRFAFEMKEKGMETFYNAMVKREPIQKAETHFVMDVDNQIQVDYITPYLQEMTSYFRKELKNYAFEISFSLNENPEKEVKFLTGKDKFTALARKNPNLHTLKTTFNLDIEF